MRLVALVFIIPWKALYMFRVLFADHRQDCLKIVHAVVGTIVYRYGVIRLIKR
jgi:hypothetical protein